MDQEVKERFKEVFEAIRAQFKVVFPNMFGGGRAELVLTNPEDLLNTGIEIEAQPQGKITTFKLVVWRRTGINGDCITLFNYSCSTSSVLYFR